MKKNSYKIYKRVLANFIDLGIIALSGLLMKSFLVKTNTLQNSVQIDNQIQALGSSSLIIFLIYSIFMLLISLSFYYAVSWTTNNGQTIGLKLMGLKLARQKNSKFTYYQSFARFFVSVFLFVLFGLDYWYLFLNKQKRTLTDIICQTKIVALKV